MLKAIETKYNGYLFRSRLEARWAVFFESMNIKYSYEQEGYDLDGKWYLPDFWISDWNCWVEIKPEIPCFRDFKNGSEPIEKKEYRLCQKLSYASGKVVMIIGGDPWINEKSYNYSGKYEHHYEIAVFSSNFIRSSDDLNSDTGVIFNLPLYDEYLGTRLTRSFYVSEERLYGHLKRNYKNNPGFFSKELPDKEDIYGLIETDKEYYRNKFGKENPIWFYGIASAGLGFVIRNSKIGISNMFTNEKPNPILIEAFSKARQARFEHN